MMSSAVKWSPHTTLIDWNTEVDQSADRWATGKQTGRWGGQLPAPIRLSESLSRGGRGQEMCNWSFLRGRGLAGVTLLRLPVQIHSWLDQDWKKSFHLLRTGRGGATCNRKLLLLLMLSWGHFFFIWTRKKKVEKSKEEKKLCDWSNCIYISFK